MYLSSITSSVFAEDFLFGTMTYGLGCSPCFVFCNFLDCALDFDQVDILVAELYDAGENGLDFGELVFVARYEV